MAMFQPFLASSTALAAPMPDPEPAMIATLRVMDSFFPVGRQANPVTDATPQTRRHFSITYPRRTPGGERRSFLRLVMPESGRTGRMTSWRGLATMGLLRLARRPLLHEVFR